MHVLVKASQKPLHLSSYSERKGLAKIENLNFVSSDRFSQNFLLSDFASLVFD